MKFYCISGDEQDVSYGLFKAAIEARDDIELVRIDPWDFDPSNPPQLERGDMLYRITTGKPASAIEQLMYREGVATLRNTEGMGDSYCVYPYPHLVFGKVGVPSPKMTAFVPKNREYLEKSVEWLGGFPVALKVPGGSHGVGVMKVDSMSSLLSVGDFVRSKRAHPILQQFINVTRSARLIVLGDKVIDSIEYAAPEGDFRSNVGDEPNVTGKVFSEEIQQTAVKATQSLGLEFAGVDILIDENDNHYVTEANFPCFFARCQKCTGNDIAGAMVDYLVAKAKRLSV
ncbi:MAG: hypothetical protein KC925_04085 [Candidatus Doudnabacteria bacterium]|nr:hypothetical protein [Candidatus Doudnabacteria bacterium]